MEMIGKSIAVAALLCAFGLWAASAQAVEIEISSPQEGQTVYPGDWVEMDVTVTNETAKKDIVHITFDLTVEIGGQPVFTGAAKRRMKLAAGETVTETIGTEVPVLPLPDVADVTIEATAKGRVSKTEDYDFLTATLSP
jgi:uncharacterized protein (DUF58 family)